MMAEIGREAEREERIAEARDRLTVATLPKGYTCSGCKKFHEYGAYVFAHWRDILTHQCECGRKVEIIMGRATQVWGKKG